jgi:hypothetical protein
MSSFLLGHYMPSLFFLSKKQDPIKANTASGIKIIKIDQSEFTVVVAFDVRKWVIPTS